MPVNNPSGDVDHIISLEEDAYADDDPITDYPDGMSIMPISATWDNSEEPGCVTCFRSDDTGYQSRTLYSGITHYREWVSEDFDPEAAWNPWTSYVTQAAFSAHKHQYITPYSTDLVAEADSFDNYNLGITIMPVTASANWNSTAADGTVITNGVKFVIDEDDVDAHQTLFIFSSNSSYTRHWTGSAWSAWARVLVVAGTPSEGDVVTYVSGVPTWAAP